MKKNSTRNYKTYQKAINDFLDSLSPEAKSISTVEFQEATAYRIYFLAKVKLYPNCLPYRLNLFVSKKDLSVKICGCSEIIITDHVLQIFQEKMKCHKNSH